METKLFAETLNDIQHSTGLSPVSYLYTELQPVKPEDRNYRWGLNKNKALSLKLDLSVQ